MFKKLGKKVLHFTIYGKQIKRRECEFTFGH